MSEAANLFVAVVAGLAFLVSVITAWTSIAQLRVAIQVRRTEDLFTLMQFLHQAEFREARNIVRGPAWDGKDREAARMVCSSFDFAGLMVRKKLVDAEVFLDYWGRPICMLADALGNFLDEAHFADGTTGREYWKDFVWLIREAQSHQRDRGDLAQPGAPGINIGVIKPKL